MIHHGHCIDVLKRLAREGVTAQMVVTSPPYWSLRDYGVPPTIWGGDPACVHEWVSAGTKEGYSSKKKWQHSESTPDAPVTRENHPDGWNQIEQGKFCACGAWLGCLGLEPTPELYVDHIVDVFAAAWDVLRDDGTLWLNLGDCYATNNGSSSQGPQTGLLAASNACAPRSKPRQHHQETEGLVPRTKKIGTPGDLKSKDLVGIPWRVARALQAGFAACTDCGVERRADLWPVHQGHRVCIDCLFNGRRASKVVDTRPGWYLRSDIIWAKSNPMPESAKDRPTKSHEYVFLLTKNEHYFYAAEAVREGLSPSTHASGNKARKYRQDHGGPKGSTRRQAHAVPWVPTSGGRNRRSVWTIPTAPFPGAHFATFPPRLVEPCILAGTSAHGCCSICGAPFTRIVTLGEPLRAQQRAAGAGKDGQYTGTATKAYDGTGAQDPSATKARILEGMRERITTGWKPTCGHTLREIEPCAVLDIFAGSGTAGMVAARLGRSFIGIELNPDWVVMGNERAAPVKAEASA